MSLRSPAFRLFMNPRFSFFIGTLLLCLALTGCETMNPAERRVQRNPELFASLKEKERAAVLRGEVAEGMSRDAVYLAWGRPGRVMTGSRNGSDQERWAYFRATPVQTTSFSYGSYAAHPFYSSYGIHPQFGYGYGPGWGVGSGIDYVPEIDRTVEFANGRVVAWEWRR